MIYLYLQSLGLQKGCYVPQTQHLHWSWGSEPQSLGLFNKYLNHLVIPTGSFELHRI